MDSAHVLIMCQDPGGRALMQSGLDAVGAHGIACDRFDDALRLPDGRNVAAIVLDVDPVFDNVAGWCQALRHRYAARRPRKNAPLGELPILAVTRSDRDADLEELFEDGVSDCLNIPFDPTRLAVKLRRWLGMPDTEPDPSAADPLASVPDPLRVRYEKTLREAPPLKALARLHGGVTARRPDVRRPTAPGDDWMGMLDGGGVSPFRTGAPSFFVPWTLDALHRVPDPAEYHPEKVVLHRAASPARAAVDVSGTPIAGDLLSVVPGRHVSAGYLACLFNSRLMEYWVARLWEAGARYGATHLSTADLARLPVIVPTPGELAYFDRAARTLAALGPRPASKRDRDKRLQYHAMMNARLFSLYDFDDEAVCLLTHAL